MLMRVSEEGKVRSHNKRCSLHDQITEHIPKAKKIKKNKENHNQRITFTQQCIMYRAAVFPDEINKC